MKTENELPKREYTKYCIDCGKLATSYCGHIHIDGKMIFAGHCNKHSQVHKSTLSNFAITKGCPHPGGCFGNKDLMETVIVNEND